jgi:nucleoside-diphosphate-sugar epimerase
MKVLITGAAGRLGRNLTRTMVANYDLVLGDVKPINDQRFIHLDIMDMAAVRAAVRQCDAVVHMVILDWPECGPEEKMRYAVPALQVHVVGLHNVLQAACEAGLRRFVYTSSVSAVDGIQHGTLVASDTRHYSNKIYGMTKGFGEDLCRMFHYSFGLSVAVLRLGTVFAPEAGGAWIGNAYYQDLAKCPAQGDATSRVHVDDVTRAIALVLEHVEPSYAVVHVVGADSGGRWDLESARCLYGWVPRYAFGTDGLPYELRAETRVAAQYPVKGAPRGTA